MRKFIFIVLCIAAVLMSCNNEDQQQTIFGDGFAISIDTSKTLEFSPVGERVEFSLTSGIPLVVTRNKTWMEISIDGKKIENDRIDIKPGHHNIVLIARCAPCLDPQQMSEGTFKGEESRKCEIKILKDSNHMVTMLNIEQKYPYLYFDKVGCSTEYKWTWADKYDEKSGYYESYEIKSNIKWKVSIDESSSQTINFIELSKENKGVDVDLNMITRTTVLLGEHWKANVANGDYDQTFLIAPCNYNFTSDPHQCRITISDITDSKEITPLTIDCTQTNLKFIVSQKDSNGDYQEIENGGELLETVEPCQPSSKEIKVESEGGLSWAFSFDKDWVSLKDNNEKNVEGDQVNADKTYTLYAHINTNDDRKDRDSYGTFTITANGATEKRKFKLTQAAFEHDVIDNNSNTVKTVSFSNMGEVQLSNNQKIYMNSSGSWECGPITYKTDTKDWLTVTPTESDKRGEKTELSLSVANQNPELKSRQAVVSFNSNDNALKSELAITQAPFIFELGSGSSTRPDVITKDDTEEKIVTLKTSGDWSAEVDKDWLTVDSEGQKNENGVSIPYSVSVNTGADERNATITIKSKYHEENNGFRELYSPIEVVIRQNGSFVVDKNEQTLSFGAFDNLSHTVNVKCLAPDGWKATYPEWLSVSPSSTKDDDINVTLTANNNSLFKSRAGSVVFTMWDEGEKKYKTRTVYVEQSAYVFEVSDIDNFGDNTNIPAYNTNGYVCYAMDIECSGKWRANVSKGVAVLSRTNNYGTSLTNQVGDGTGEHLYIFVKNNNNEQPRNIQVSIVCDGDSTDGKNTKTFTATQLKYDFSVSTKSIDGVEAEVKEGKITRSFTITCSGKWSIDCGEDKDWLSVDYSGETGNKTTEITVNVKPNNTTNSRTGVVTINSEDLNKSLTVKINQQYVKFDKFASGLTFDAIPSEAKQITIKCTGSWEYDSEGTEISAKIEPETGFGETDIKIKPDPNYSFEDKKDKKIYFVNKLTKQEQYVSVTVNGYVLNVPNEIEVFGKDGEEREILVECSGIWDVKSADISWIEKCEKSSKDSKLVIKVSKNDTGKDREGTIYIWAENNENLIREIKVKQTK
uniref:BACON domain-containing protein n=1 Tax=Alistipes sp. TaxID=1872444 RepID=UPI004056B14D